MREIITYIKVNILGIAVAIGVCSFLYEGLIRCTGDFYLTEIAGSLIFFVATTSKFKDNRERRNQLERNRDKKDNSDTIDIQQNPL